MRMSEDAKYILTMDKETALMVDRACEFYARMVFGQFKEAANEVFYAWPEKYQNENFCEMKERAEAYLTLSKMELFPELHPGASYGVGHNRSSDVAWNIHQVIRYGISWHDHPEGGLTVNFDKPMRYADSPMPEFEIADMKAKEDN